MPTTQQYLDQLVRDKNTLINAYKERNVDVAENATFTDLAGMSGSLPTGGGSTVEEETIEFYDYDGAFITKWNLSEVASKTSMPTPPTHEGLVFQEWNWTLDELKELNRSMDVGANYITDDRTTKFYIDLKEASYDVNIMFTQNYANAFEIDWGDGSPTKMSGPTTSTSVKFYLNHKYEEAGNYIIRLINHIPNPENTTYYFSTSGTSSNQPFSTSTLSQNKYVHKNLLQKVEIGDGFEVTSFCFNYCYGLKTITFPARERYNAFLQWNNIFQANYSLRALVLPRILNGGVPLGQSIGSQFYALEKIVIPKETYSYTIATSFNGTKIKRLTLPDGITSIPSLIYMYLLEKLSVGENAILSGSNDSCRKMKKFKTSNATTSLPQRAFSNWYSAEEIVLNEGLQTIQTYAFENIPLRKITIPSTVTTIGNSAFASSLLEEISFPDSVTSIGENVCGSCYFLKKIKLPSNLTAIPNSLIYLCYNIESIEIPSSVTSIGTSAFSNTLNLKEITLPSGLTSIGASAFLSSGIQKIKIPAGVSTIPTNCFGSCSCCKYFDFSDHTSVPTLANTNAFSTTIGSIIVPDELYDSWIATQNWSTYASRIVKASEYVWE